MKLLKFFCMITTTFILHACSDGMQTPTTDVEFSKLNNYFVRNTVPLSGHENYFVLDDRQEFDGTFGVGRTMDNTTENIDFSKYIVAAVVMNKTNIETEINITSVKQHNDDLYVSYSITRGKELSYTATPFNAVKIKRGDYTNIQFWDDTVMKQVTTMK